MWREARVRWQTLQGVSTWSSNAARCRRRSAWPRTARTAATCKSSMPASHQAAAGGCCNRRKAVRRGIELRGCRARWSCPRPRRGGGRRLRVRIFGEDHGCRGVRDLGGRLDHVGATLEPHEHLHEPTKATTMAARVYASCVRAMLDALQRRRELGLGARSDISSRRLHADGTMGLERLTTEKWASRGRADSRVRHRVPA